MEKFDYEKAMARLEEIARKVEDPSTALGDIDAYLKETDELIGACRKYLRTARETLEGMDK